MTGLIDYGAGNTASVENVLKQLSVPYKIIKTEYDALNCEKIILPGVGEAKFAMKRLTLNNLINYLKIIKKPILGICLGMQLFCNKSEESDASCLGIIDCDVKKFINEIKIPHMGWNSVKIIGNSKLLIGIPDESYFYFAHSFYLPLLDMTRGITEYSTEFSSVIESNNFYGVQFHPEKSGEYGIKLINNFLELC